MKIVTIEQMRQLERRADAAGVSYAQMMESAGRAVADEITRRAGADVRDKKILVLVGPGNNGGDGLVAAHYLQEAGASVSLYVWNRKTEDDANFKRIQRTISTLRAEDDDDLARLRAQLDESAVIVDALLGTGANRPIEGTLKEILHFVKSQIANRKSQIATSNFQPPTSNYQLPAVIAVDLPSGTNADTGALDPATVHADLTVTFAYPKVGFYKFPAADALGELVIADIGIPPSFADDITLNLASIESIRPLLPARPRDGHKGTFGKAMIVAGSANYSGAPFLAAAAAARIGTGLVTLATTSDAQRIVASALHEATYLLLPSTTGAIAASASAVALSSVAGYDALLIGPGLGRATGTENFVYRVLGVQSRQTRKQRALPPLIVDADGLNALSRKRGWWRKLPPRSILTPHVGEFARLTKLSSDEINADRIGCARQFAKQWNQIVLLKGAFTLVAEPNEQVTMLPFANPALATAGSGDVLSGIIVGLMAQGLSPRDAAIAGGTIHGVAGELARQEIGDAGVLASDLLPRIPRALRVIKSEVPSLP